MSKSFTGPLSLFFQDRQTAQRQLPHHPLHHGLPTQEAQSAAQAGRHPSQAGQAGWRESDGGIFRGARGDLPAGRPGRQRRPLADRV